MGTPSLDRVPNLVKLSREDSNPHTYAVADLLHRQNTNFPGAQPVSFARRHLKELEKVDYFCAEKTDGIRLLLFLTSIGSADGSSIEAQFLIDRKNDYYYIQSGYLHIPLPHPRNPNAYDINSYHRGTLLDGELVLQRHKNGREQLTFLIFDCLAIQGECITKRDYGQRIQKILSGVVKPWRLFAKEWPQDAAQQPFQLDVKEPKAAYGAPELFVNIIPNLPHGNDGLIFTCKETPYVSGTDQHILKWKPPHENTVDFRLQMGEFPRDDDGDEDFDQKPEMELLVYHGNRNDYRFFAPLHVTDAEWESMKAMNQMFDHRVIECWREKDTGNWRPKIEEDGTPRFRDDKDHGNHFTVVESVLESIEDAVSQQDLTNAYSAIRTAWKERERVRMEQFKRQQQQEAKQREAQAQAQVKEDTGPAYSD
jgi:mRNA guanylyltransferase